jgi:hypothetical protein
MVQTFFFGSNKHVLSQAIGGLFNFQKMGQVLVPAKGPL